jgi:DNA-binding NtrC family response regulator
MGMVSRTALLVFGDVGESEKIRNLLGPLGFDASTTPSTLAGLDVLEREPFDLVVLSDAGVSAERSALVRRAQELRPDLPLVLVSAGEPAAIDGLDTASFDFLQAPFRDDDARAVLKQALLRAERTDDAEALSVRPEATTAILGESKEMQATKTLVERAARTQATVLIRGESGSGKEVVARSIHERSERRHEPFVKVHCAAIPEQLLESELFGHEKGAFTGATARKPGRFEVAGNGTVFLDEIGDVPLPVQVKLLRVVQDGTYERVGGTQSLRVGARFIAATHRNLEQMVKTEDFREDLFYRLNVIPITVAPLRKRRSDIPNLVSHFCRRSAARHGRGAVTVTDEAVALLSAGNWPGNVRPLENFIERLIVLGDDGVVGRTEVERELEREAGGVTTSDGRTEASFTDLSVAVERAERAAIQKALGRAKGNRAVAARLLRVSLRTLFYKLKEYGLG